MGDIRLDFEERFKKIEELYTLKEAKQQVIDDLDKNIDGLKQEFWLKIQSVEDSTEKQTYNKLIDQLDNVKKERDGISEKISELNEDIIAQAKLDLENSKIYNQIKNKDDYYLIIHGYSKYTKNKYYEVNFMFLSLDEFENLICEDMKKDELRLLYGNAFNNSWDYINRNDNYFNVISTNYYHRGNRDCYGFAHEGAKVVISEISDTQTELYFEITVESSNPNAEYEFSAMNDPFYYDTAEYLEYCFEKIVYETTIDRNILDENILEDVREFLDQSYNKLCLQVNFNHR